jgi:hypothetical protein
MGGRQVLTPSANHPITIASNSFGPIRACELLPVQGRRYLLQSETTWRRRCQRSVDLRRTVPGRRSYCGACRVLSRSRCFSKHCSTNDQYAIADLICPLAPSIYATIGGEYPIDPAFENRWQPEPPERKL